MVLNISNVFGFGRKRHRPLINQIPISTTQQPVGVTSTLIQKNKFWRWARARPELNAPVSIRVDDTISTVEFFKPDGTPLGRNSRIKEEKFWDDNSGYERLKSMQFDRLITGSGYLWKGKVDKEGASRSIGRIFNMFEFKGINFRKVKAIVRKRIDEDLRLPRVLDYIASSTMQIAHDKHEILNYIQWFGADHIEFSTEEIIHIPLHRVDGKVEGFTPVESLGYELVLLWAIKENMLSYIRNGGSPNKAWVLPEELANSDNHQWLVKELMNRGTLENRHGNLVLTGKVEIQELEKDIKDMEYKDLSLWLTSNIAYALRIPNTRIPYLIGSSAHKSDAGGMAESGYWSMIESDQKTIEQHLNNQLFNERGVMIKFKKNYKLNDIRESQTFNFTMDATTKMVMELKNAGLKLNHQKLVSLLSGCERTVSMNDIEEMTEEEKMNDFQKTGLLNKSFMKDNQMKTPAQQNKDDTKRQGALNNPKGSSQTGF